MDINDKLKTERVGEVNKNKQGLTMKIINYRNAKDVDVEFENGVVRYNILYGNFKKGNVYGGEDFVKFKKASDRINKNDFLKYVEQGLNQRECAEKFGVNRQALRKWMKDNNLNVKFVRYRDLTGMKFGRLYVIEKNGLDKNSKMTWRCKCDCGNEKIVVGTHLVEGGTLSCGCLSIDLLIKRNINSSNLNGASASEDRVVRRLAGIYSGMKRRCYNENSDDYNYYGGRGITICNEWLYQDGFYNFLN